MLTPVVYTNIDQERRNKLHGPMHYKIGVPCVFKRHKTYTVVITRHSVSNSPISKFRMLCIELKSV